MAAQNTRDLNNCRIQHIRLWLKSFVPDDVDGAQPVPSGPHAGKSMFRSPGPIEAWFLTDQRGFSEDPAASARMHSQIEIDLLEYRITGESHWCSPTIQVDHTTGEEDCQETADTSDMHFTDFKASPEDNQISMHLRGATKNSCLKIGPVKVSPNLNYEGDIVLRLNESGDEAVVTFDGDIETYPAFEMYITVNDGPAVTIFREPILPGKTPTNLVGPPGRAVHQSITISC
jgi:hypothetical protein